VRGSVYRRVRHTKDGKTRTLWYAIVDKPSPDGTRRQDWGRGFRTRREADAELARKLAALGSGSFVDRSPLTVERYLTEWLNQTRFRVKATTHDGYEQVVRDYVVPHIGEHRLQDLRPLHLTALYSLLLERGGRGQRRGSRAAPSPRPEGPLGPKTVRNVHALVSKALGDAVDDGLLAANPAAKARPPSAPRGHHNMRSWTADELRSFLTFVAGDELSAAWRLAASTGMRRGEILGLRWSDVDTDKRIVVVRHTIVLVKGHPHEDTPKNHEARTIDIDAATAAALRSHRTRQAQDRLAWGPDYTDSGLVFRREDGTGIHPDRFSQRFDALVAKSSVRRIVLHDLRHTHATLLLKAGVPVKVVSERLGHADPAFTMRVYQHVLPGMQADAAAQFAGLLNNPETPGTGLTAQEP